MKGLFSSLFFLSICLAACFSGCSATAPASKVRPQNSARLLAHLRKGQTSNKVETLLGKPGEVRSFPVKDGDLQSEVWVYRLIVEEKEWQVPTGIREVPAVNPHTGQAIVIQEPIYETQLVKTVDVLELLIVEQQLIEWKSRRETVASIQQR